MPYSTLTEANDPALKEPDVLEAAAAIVASVAPPPETFDTAADEADYTERAGRAERVLYRYMVADGHTLASKSLSGVGGRSYKDDREVRRIARQIMGRWAVGATPYPIR